MKIRYYAIVLLITLALGVSAALIVFPLPETQMNTVEINDITATLSADFNLLTNAGYTLPGSGALDYTVINPDGNLLAATRSGLSEDVYAAIRHGDTIVDITKDGQSAGKVLFWNDAEIRWSTYRNRLQACAIGIMCVFAGAYAVLFIDLHKRILSPFKRMNAFAQRIAAGELEIPLEMDRRNIFGDFTESFDLMREELHRARENERLAEQSKRELVASLSHDIQTPVASIKAVAELMDITADQSLRAKLNTIQQKAGQIQSLVSDLFHATLEELNSLPVKPVSFPSGQLAEIVERADYQGRVKMGAIPGCLLLADPVRLAQVLDNVIANSYKYAGTVIDVYAETDGSGLTLTVRDYGTGAEPDELPLLCGKYYRGKTAENKNGYGLGLYISRTLTERMGGRLQCGNADPGFKVSIWLKYDG